MKNIYVCGLAWNRTTQHCCWRTCEAERAPKQVLNIIEYYRLINNNDKGTLKLGG